MTFELEAVDLGEDPQALDVFITCLDQDLLDDDLIGVAKFDLGNYIKNLAGKPLEKFEVEIPIKNNNKFTGILHLSLSTIYKGGETPDGNKVPPLTLVVEVLRGEELTTPMTAVDSDDQTFGQFCFYTLVLLAYMGGYSAFFHFWEDWTWSEGIYFSIVTFSTVGYGDLSPTTDGGKWFIIGTGLFGVGVGGVCLNNMLSYFIALWTRVVKGCRKSSTRRKNKTHRGKEGTKVAPTDYHDENVVHASKNLALKQNRKPPSR